MGEDLLGLVVLHLLSRRKDILLICQRFPFIKLFKNAGNFPFTGSIYLLSQRFLLAVL